MQNKDFSSTPIKAIYNPHSPITKFIAAEISAKYAPKQEIFKLIATNIKPVQISRGIQYCFGETWLSIYQRPLKTNKKKKDCPVWVWLSVERQTELVVGYQEGERNEESALGL